MVALPQIYPLAGTAEKDQGGGEHGDREQGTRHGEGSEDDMKFAIAFSFFSAGLCTTVAVIDIAMGEALWAAALGFCAATSIATGIFFLRG